MNFEVKDLGEASYVLGTKIHRDHPLKSGISFVLNASSLSLIIESDSLTATQLLLKEEACYAVEGVLVKEIRRLLASTSSCFVHFILRTANGVVDRIVRFNLS